MLKKKSKKTSWLPAPQKPKHTKTKIGAMFALGVGSIMTVFFKKKPL